MSACLHNEQSITGRQIRSDAELQGSLQALQGLDTVFTKVEPASQIFEESTVLHVGTYCAQLL